MNLKNKKSKLTGNFDHERDEQFDKISPISFMVPSFLYINEQLILVWCTSIQLVVINSNYL
jgi:hypothetical protein